MMRLDSISWPTVEAAKPPSGWGLLPELCCLLLVSLSVLLYLADEHIAVAVVDVAVVAPQVKLAKQQPAPQVGFEPEATAAKLVAVLPQQAITQTLGKSIEAGSAANATASVVASEAWPQRYVGTSAGGYSLAWLWQQRAAHAASSGDYSGADRIYSQAMSLAVADLPLLQALAQERSLWLRHRGRNYAAIQVLQSVGLQP